MAQQLPSMITLLVCIVLVIARLEAAPDGLAAGSYRSLPVVPASPFFHVDLCPGPSLFLGKNYTSEDIRNLFFVLGLIFNSTRVIAFAPLLAAIFIGRPR
jgi:hypothetical protein